MIRLKLKMLNTTYKNFKISTSSANLKKNISTKRPSESEQAWDALLSVLTDGQATSEVPPNMRSKYELFRASDVVVIFLITQLKQGGVPPDGSKRRQKD